MQYKASLDTLAKIITAGVVILFVAVGQDSAKELIHANGDTTVIITESGLLLLFILVFVGCWFYAPQSYTIDNTNLIINRKAGNIIIKRADIAHVRAMDNSEMKWALRTFGVSGLFGYYGKFYAPKIGSITMYATQRKNRILILTKQGQKIIITPDDTGMIEKLKQ